MRLSKEILRGFEGFRGKKHLYSVKLPEIKKL